MRDFEQLFTLWLRPFKISRDALRSRKSNVLLFINLYLRICSVPCSRTQVLNVRSSRLPPITLEPIIAPLLFDLLDEAKKRTLQNSPFFSSNRQNLQKTLKTPIS